MEIQIQRETLLKPLLLVSGAVEKRQTLPVLSHVLLRVNGQQLSVTATDLEVELVGQITLNTTVTENEITVPARKFIDICRNLPDEAQLNIALDGNRLIIKSGRSRFALSTLPASEFPRISDSPTQMEFSITQAELKHLLNSTHFAMAQQDVRYYLNGMLFDLSTQALQVIATDGHRLALSSLASGSETRQQTTSQVIVPRKGVMELLRLLNNDEEVVKVAIGTSHIHVTGDNFVFTSKLIEGKFPDFNRVIPKDSNKIVTFDRDILKKALARASILCNEKFHGVRIFISENLMKITANNPEQEEAEEEIEINYQGKPLEVGFNVDYLLDVLSVLSPGEIKMSLQDANSSTLLEHAKNSESVYVIMPMRL
jgi:DNA polymerase III subunit beta